MADSEVRQKFEAWLREELLLLGASPHLVIARLARTAPMRVFDYADDSTEFKWRGFQAGMRAGEIAQQEELEEYKRVSLGNLLCDQESLDELSAECDKWKSKYEELRKAIRALPLSGAEKSVPAAPEEKKP